MDKSIKYIRSKTELGPQDYYLRIGTPRWTAKGFPTAGKFIKIHKYRNNDVIFLKPNEGFTNIRVDQSKNVGRIEIAVGPQIIFKAHHDFFDFSQPIDIITSLWDEFNDIDPHTNALPYIRPSQFWEIRIYAKDEFPLWEREKLNYNFTYTVDVVAIEIDNSKSFEFCIKQKEYFYIPAIKNYKINLSHPTFNFKLKFYEQNANINSITLDIFTVDGECTKLPFTRDGTYWTLNFPISKDKDISTVDEVINFSCVNSYISVDGEDYLGCVLEQSHFNVLRHMDKMMGIAYSN